MERGAAYFSDCCGKVHIFHHRGPIIRMKISISEERQEFKNRLLHYIHPISLEVAETVDFHQF